MFKLLLLIALISSYLNAQDNLDKVEVYATKMATQDNIVKATGDVVVVYQDYHLTAQKAIYNRNTGLLELFDNIRASKGDNIKLLGNYAKLNIAKKERAFKPFYMLERTSNVWMSGCESSAKDIEVKIKSGVMSGCNPQDPLWTMEFSEAQYNTDSMWLDLYNTRIYIYDIPVFYTPYFGYSLNTTRRTGVLPPMLGYSGDEGFYYEQSLFIAESNWWDLEITPQIRTSRGAGVYSTFRFVDSAVSKGDLTLGYFQEQDSYLKARDTFRANKEHYGFNFHYENSDFLNQLLGTDFKGQSGAYIDLKDMNDVDYINLSSNNTVDTVTPTQVISRANFFYNTDNNYFGLYFKYYKDLTLESNSKTLQNIPAFQYHSYLDTLLQNHFLYSLDIKSNNYYRQDGQGAIQTDLNIPLTFQTSIFDEYINISYTSYIYAQQTTFNSQEASIATQVKDGYLARNYHVFNTSSQLTRAYDNITHVVDIGAQYILAGDEIRNNFYDIQKDYCTNQNNIFKPDYNDRCEFYNVTDVQENLQIYFSQYIYNTSGKQILYHRLSQRFTYNDINNKVGELENELDYRVTDHISFYNNMFFNFDENSFSKNFNKISYHDDTINLALSHMYQNSFIRPLSPRDPLQHTSYLTSSLSYRYNKHYSYNFRFDFDLELKEKKATEIGFLYKQRCWDFGIRYIENNRPVLNINGSAGNVYDKYIYFTIAFKPIMSSNRASGFVYKLPNSDR